MGCGTGSEICHRTGPWCVDGRTTFFCEVWAPPTLRRLRVSGGDYAVPCRLASSPTLRVLLPPHRTSKPSMARSRSVAAAACVLAETAREPARVGVLRAGHSALLIVPVRPACRRPKCVDASHRATRRRRPQRSATQALGDRAASWASRAAVLRAAALGARAGAKPPSTCGDYFERAIAPRRRNDDDGARTRRRRRTREVALAMRTATTRANRQATHARRRQRARTRRVCSGGCFLFVWVDITFFWVLIGFCHTPPALEWKFAHGARQSPI